MSQRSKPELLPCSYDSSHPWKLHSAVEIAKSRTGKFYCGIECKHKDSRTRLDCKREECNKRATKEFDPYCSRRCDKLDHPQMTRCAYEGCEKPEFVIPPEIYRNSRTKRFFCGDPHEEAWKIDQLSECKLPRCSNKAPKDREFCCREHSDEFRTKEKIWIPCGECLGGGRNYFPSTVPPTGRCICDRCLKEKGTNGRRGTKPRRGIYKKCETDGCCNFVYEGPNEERHYCGAEHRDQARIVERQKYWCQYEKCEDPEFELVPGQAAWRSNKYCCSAHSQLAKIKRGTGEFFNGREVILDQNNYKLLWFPDHPNAHHGRIPAHVLAKETSLGRPIKDGYDIHHKDEDKWNNDPENNLEEKEHLEHLAHSSRSYHQRVKQEREMLALYIQTYGEIRMPD